MRTIEEIKADIETAIASHDTERMNELYREKALFYMRNIPLNRLKEICNAEREGRCVVMPCKPHQIVYFIGVEFSKCTEYGEKYDESACDGCEVKCDSKKVYKVFTTRAEDLRWIFLRYFDFGKIYFTTREAAEKALKE